LKNIEYGDTLPIMSVRESIIKERVDNPSATLKQIGDKFGVSREWVRQVLVAGKLPTRHWPVQYYICNNCRKCFKGKYNRSKLFCSKKCRIAYYTASVECETCGTLFTRQFCDMVKGLRTGQHHFCCSPKCRSKMLSLNYGFGALPQNTYRFVKRPSKWAEFRSLIIEKLEQGYSLTGIMRELGIPRSSYYIIKGMFAEDQTGR
jgi:hypothetical protein